MTCYKFVVFDNISKIQHFERKKSTKNIKGAQIVIRIKCIILKNTYKPLLDLLVNQSSPKSYQVTQLSDMVKRVLNRFGVLMSFTCSLPNKCLESKSNGW